MTQLLINNVENGLLDSLRVRARTNGRSVEEEARQILSAVLVEAVSETWMEIDNIRTELENQHGLMPDSTDLIRKDRQR